MFIEKDQSPLFYPGVVVKVWKLTIPDLNFKEEQIITNRNQKTIRFYRLTGKMLMETEAFATKGMDLSD